MLSGQSGTLPWADDGSWPPVLLCLLGGFQLLRNGQPIGVRSRGGASPIVNTAGRYRLNAEAGVATDVARFDGLVKRGERLERSGQPDLAADAHARAVGLYRRDLASAG